MHCQLLCKSDQTATQAGRITMRLLGPFLNGMWVEHGLAPPASSDLH